MAYGIKVAKLFLYLLKKATLDTNHANMQYAMVYGSLFHAPATAGTLMSWKTLPHENKKSN